VKADLAFEIKCREILIKRLGTSLSSLTRTVDKENTDRQERVKELSVYQSVQEAHDAYGFDYITWDEFETIKRRFEDAEYAEETSSTTASAALSILKEFIGRLQADIRHFKWEALSPEEKRRIEKENAELRKRAQDRKVGK